MRIFKSHPLLKLVNSYIIDSPQPSNLSYLWNFGSLLAVCLIIQIITGVTLAMHYNPSVSEAFNSIEHIMRDVNNGWLIRYLHSNTASAFFFLVYLHIGRGLYYGSYRAPRTLVWTIGTVIFILMMATGFLGYVLPYGQMSLWGATVITNLMSAIPWVGQDIVEFLWGGLSQLLIEEPNNSDVVQQILLNAGISPILVLGYGCVLLIEKSTNMDVKKPKSRGQSAGVRKLATFEAPQRLNAENLNYAYLVGLFEGDGFFTVSKKGIYFQCELGIELSIKDVKLIYKIKDILGVGIIGFRIRNGNSMVYLRVRKKDHLINKVLPIFDRYPLLSNKQYDYLRLRSVILSNVIFYDSIPIYTRPTLPINTIESIINKPYFSAWLIGFIEAEGCFSVYKLVKDGDYFVASFDISQTNGEILILAIRKYLSLTPKVYKDKTNNFKLKVSSVRSIENVIKFIDKAPVKLLGHKKIQYILWIKKLRAIPRYVEKINIPLLRKKY
jgi:hypothetical protein